MAQFQWNIRIHCSFKMSIIFLFVQTFFFNSLQAITKKNIKKIKIRIYQTMYYYKRILGKKLMKLVLTMTKCVFHKQCQLHLVSRFLWELDLEEFGRTGEIS